MILRILIIFLDQRNRTMKTEELTNRVLLLLREEEELAEFLRFQCKMGVSNIFFSSIKTVIWNFFGICDLKKLAFKSIYYGSNYATNNYWMRLSGISRIIEAEVGVILLFTWNYLSFILCTNYSLEFFSFILCTKTKKRIC